VILALALFLAAPPVTAIAVAPDGKSVLVGSQAGVEARSYPSLEPTRSLPTEIPNVHDLAFSPDGKLLAVAGGLPGKRGLIDFFAWPEGKLLRSASVHRDCVYKVAWRSDSASVLTAGGGANVCVVQVETGKVVQTLDGHSKGVLAVAFLPGEEQLVSAGLDESVRLWTAKTGEPVRSFANHTQPVTDLAVRPGTDAKTPPTLVSVSEDRTVRLWQPTVGRLVRFARLDTVPVAVAWSRGGDRILTACKDGRVRVIDPDTMNVTETLAGIDGVAYCLAVTPDGHVLVGGRGGQVKRIGVKH
jgi:DNA-binding beta-propeller fold protein YncE